MAREEFFLSLRLADRLLAPPQVRTDSPKVSPKGVAATLERAELWLTPKVVEGFRPEDFADLPPPQREKLQRAVAEFLEVARTVPPDAPATRKQAQKGRSNLEQILSIARETLLADWLPAVEELTEDVESWSAHKDWAVKRDTKKVTEEVLRTYEVPRLLVHTLDGRLLLDPVARFVVGAAGLVELCVMPSYDSQRITRRDNNWYLEPLRPTERRQNLSEAVFHKAVLELLLEK